MLAIAPTQVGSVRGNELGLLHPLRPCLWHEPESGERAREELWVLGHSVRWNANESTAWDDSAVLQTQVVVNQPPKCH